MMNYSRLLRIAFSLFVLLLPSRRSEGQDPAGIQMSRYACPDIPVSHFDAVRYLSADVELLVWEQNSWRRLEPPAVSNAPAQASANGMLPNDFQPAVDLYRAQLFETLLETFNRRRVQTNSGPPILNLVRVAQDQQQQAFRTAIAYHGIIKVRNITNTYDSALNIIRLTIDEELTISNLGILETIRPCVPLHQEYAVRQGDEIKELVLRRVRNVMENIFVTLPH